MEDVVTYIFPESLTEQHLINEISKCYPIKRDTICNKHETYFDTFDWRLSNKKLILVKADEDYYLRSMLNDNIFHRICLKTKKQPKFWWDFPDSKLKEFLKSCLEIYSSKR